MDCGVAADRVQASDGTGAFFRRAFREEGAKANFRAAFSLAAR